MSNFMKINEIFTAAARDIPDFDFRPAFMPDDASALDELVRTAPNRCAATFSESAALRAQSTGILLVNFLCGSPSTDRVVIDYVMPKLVAAGIPEARDVSPESPDHFAIMPYGSGIFICTDLSDMTV